MDGGGPRPWALALFQLDGLFIWRVWAADKISYHGSGPKRLQRLLPATAPPSSWKIKQIQHPRVREAFNPCSASALIFHGLLLLILVGIIDLERALPRRNERLWGAGQKKKKSSIMVLTTWDSAAFFPGSAPPSEWLRLQYLICWGENALWSVATLKQDKMSHSLFNS